MRLVRYMNTCEYAALVVTGRIDGVTAPFAVVGQDEKLTDTHPSPPPGTLCLWSDEQEDIGWRFGEHAIWFDVPDVEISWTGIGTYRQSVEKYSNDGYDHYTWNIQEYGTIRLLRSWIIEAHGPAKDEPGFYCDDHESCRTYFL